MSESRRLPPSDRVSFEPTVDDTRGFTIGLWSVQTVLFALVLAGFTVLRGLGDSVTVLVACGSLVWFGAVTAIVLRGRLQPMPGLGARVLAVVAVVALAVWFGISVALGGHVSSGGPVSLGARVGLDCLGLALECGALVACYRARMFRWAKGSRT